MCDKFTKKTPLGVLCVLGGEILKTLLIAFLFFADRVSFISIIGEVMMKKKVLISAGGTGGHIYPALALAQQLKRLSADIQILFVAGGLTSNPYFDRESYAYEEVPVALFSKKSLSARFVSLFSLSQGVTRSRKIIRDFRPDIVVGFGSYYTFPTLLAAKICRVPIILHEANAIPGKVNRLLSKYVEVTGTHFPQTATLLKGKAIEVGMPLRDGYTLAFSSQQKARSYFHIASDRFTFLVFGGSQGAHRINALFCGAATNYLASRMQNFQVLHFTGDAVWTQRIQDRYDELGITAYVADSEERMDHAWAAADMVVARAGASTIAEMMEFEVPGVLIPWSGAMDNHQEHNANFMESTVEGAIKCCEQGLDAEGLAESISTFIVDEKRQLTDMKEAIQEYKKQIRRRDLCSVVCEIAAVRTS